MDSGHKQLIGSIAEYNSSLDDWNVYYERLEQFFEVNDVPDEKRSAFLISVIGAEAYKSLRDLCHPVLPRDKPFEDLCELLRRQFSPQISIFRERVKFYNAHQEPYENVTQWYGKLKRLSVDCKFGATLESVLVDKFITGLRAGQVLDRLCEENEALKLEQALDIAVNKECAAKENAYVPYVAPPRVTKCFFGGEPVKARLAICPPAPSGFKPQALGFDGANQLFTDHPVQAQSYSFGAPAASAPQACLFGAANKAAESLEQPEEVAPPPVGAFAKCADIPQEEALQQDGVPEGADPVGGSAAKGRRVRTRRRCRARRGAAGDAGDQNSVDGEQE